MSSSAPSDQLPSLTQDAWRQLDAADFAEHGGNPFRACFSKGWGYSLTMRFEGLHPAYYVAVHRHDADACRNARSGTAMAAVGEAYVAALKRQAMTRLN